MEKLNDFNVLRPVVNGQRLVVLEAPRRTFKNGFTDKDRKKLIDTGFILMQERRAIPPLGMDNATALGQLQTIFAANLEPSNAIPELETKVDAALLPNYISIGNEKLQPQVDMTNGVATLVLAPSVPNGKIATALDSSPSIIKQGDVYYMESTPNESLALQKLIRNQGGIAHLSLDSITEFPKMPTGGIVNEVIPLVNENGTVDLGIVADQHPVTAEAESRIAEKLLHSGNKAEYEKGTVLKTVSASGEVETMTLDRDMTVFKVPANQMRKKPSGAQINPPRGADYINQARAFEATLYDLRESPAAVFQQRKSNGNVVGFTVSVPAELQARMRSHIGAGRDLSKCEFPIYSSYPSKITGYTYNFSRLDGVTMIEALDDLMRYSGKLSETAKRARPYTDLHPDGTSPIDIANAHYRDSVRTDEDVLQLLRGEGNSTYCDAVVDYLSSTLSKGDVGGLDWKRSAGNIQLGKNGTYMIKANQLDCGYNKSSRDKDMWATIRIFSDMTANVSLRKAGGSGRNENGGYDDREVVHANFAQIITKAFKEYNEEEIARASVGGDFSSIIARRMEEQQRRYEAQEKLKAQRELEVQRRQEQIVKDQQQFAEKHKSATLPLDQTKEYQKKGLSDLVPYRNQKMLRAGIEQRFDGDRQVNIQALYVPYTWVSSSDPAKDNKVASGQTILNDGSGKSEKRFMTGSAWNEEGNGIGNAPIYQTKPISGEYNEYVVTEGWAEAEWYQAHLTKRGITDVWVGAAGSAFTIPTAIKIIDQKYPGKLKTVLADNDAHKRFVENAGINSVFQSAHEMITQNGTNTSTLRFTTIPSKELAIEGAGLMTDLTDVTADLTATQMQAVFNALDINSVGVYSGDAPINVTNPRIIDEERSPEETLKELYRLDRDGNGDMAYIHTSLAKKVIQDALFEYVRSAYHDIALEPVAANEKGKAISSSLVVSVAQANFQALPIRIGTVSKDYTIENGQPVAKGYSSLSGSMSNIDFEPNEDGVIVHNYGSEAGKPFLPANNQREHVVSRDGIISQYSDDTKKQLRSTMKEGDSFSTPVSTAYALNYNFQNFMRNKVLDAIKGSLKEAPEKAVAYGSKMAKLIIQAGLKNMTAKQRDALVDLSNAINNPKFDGKINGVEVHDSLLKSPASKALLTALADPSRTADYAKLIITQFRIQTEKEKEREAKMKNAGEVGLAQRVIATGKGIVSAVESVNSLSSYFFPSKLEAGGLIQIHQDKLNNDQFTVLRFSAADEGKLTSQKVLTRQELILDKRLQQEIAYIPTDPFVARIEAMQHMLGKQLDSQKITPKDYQAKMDNIEQSAKRRKTRNEYIGNGVTIDSYLTAANIDGKTLGVSLNKRIIDFAEGAEPFLKLPTFSVDNNFVSLRGSKEHTNASKMEAEIENSLMMAKQLEAQGAPKEIVDYHRTTAVDNIKQNAQSSYERGDLKEHHTASKDGKSQAVFVSNLAAWLVEKKDGKGHWRRALMATNQLLHDCKDFREAYGKYFGMSMPTDEKLRNKFMGEFIPFPREVRGLEGETHKLDPVKAAKDYQFLNVKNSAMDYVRMVGHSEMSGSRVQAYKFPDPDNKHNKQSERMYRGSAGDLKHVIAELKTLQESGVPVTYALLNKPTQVERNGKKAIEDKLFAIAVPLQVEDAKGVKHRVVETINEALHKKELLSLAEFRHLEDPAKVPSPYVKAVDRGITERQSRELIAAYADKPPAYSQNPSTQLLEHDPARLAIAKEAEKAEQRRLAIEEGKKLERNNAYAREKAGQSRMPGM